MEALVFTSAFVDLVGPIGAFAFAYAVGEVLGCGLGALEVRIFGLSDEVFGDYRSWGRLCRSWDSCELTCVDLLNWEKLTA